MTLAASAAALVAVPPVARVTDLTETLDAGQRRALEQRLAAFEARKGSQIVVLVVPTTQPEEIEQYGIRVMDTWKIGRKGVDDGVIVLVAKNDRKLRIEVGYGLEGAVPDAIGKRIIEETIKPYFKAGDFYGGLNAGVDQLMHVIDGEPLPPPEVNRSSGESLEERQQTTMGFIMVMLFTIVSIGSILAKHLGAAPPAALGGGLMGFAAWRAVEALAAGAVVGVVMFFIFLLIFSAKPGRGGRGSGWGGFSSGGGGGW